MQTGGNYFGSSGILVIFSRSWRRNMRSPKVNPHCQIRCATGCPVPGKTSNRHGRAAGKAEMDGNFRATRDVNHAFPFKGLRCHMKTAT